MQNSAESVEALFSWMKSNWETLVKKCPPSLTMLGTMVQLCTRRFTHQDQLDQVQAFFEGKSTKGFDRALQQSGDSIRANISWVQRDGGDVQGWLEKEGYLAKSGGGKL